MAKRTEKVGGQEKGRTPSPREQHEPTWTLRAVASSSSLFAFAAVLALALALALALIPVLYNRTSAEPAASTVAPLRFPFVCQPSVTVPTLAWSNSSSFLASLLERGEPAVLARAPLAAWMPLAPDVTELARRFGSDRVSVHRPPGGLLRFFGDSDSWAASAFAWVRERHANASARERVSLASLARAVAAGESWYAESRMADMPALARATGLRAGARVPWTRAERTIWDAGVWAGATGVAAAAHYDFADNLFFQLGGTKHVTLLPPSTLAALAFWPRQHPGYLTPQLNVLAPNLTLFPAAAHLPCAHVTVGPGDALYIPYAWVHHIEITAAATSLNMWLEGGPRALYTRIQDTVLPYPNDGEALEPIHRVMLMRAYTALLLEALAAPDDDVPRAMRRLTDAYRTAVPALAREVWVFDEFFAVCAPNATEFDWRRDWAVFQRSPAVPADRRWDEQTLRGHVAPLAALFAAYTERPHGAGVRDLHLFQWLDNYAFSELGEIGAVPAYFALCFGSRADLR